jgi:hypothetical protein
VAGVRGELALGVDQGGDAFSAGVEGLGEGVELGDAGAGRAGREVAMFLELTTKGDGDG